MYKNLKFYCAILVFCVFAVASVSADVVKPFMAGQHTQVGEVTVSTDGDGNVVVAIELDPGNEWCLFLTHVYVGEDPPAKGAPGQFPYSEPVTDCKSQTYVIDPGDAEEVYVAVHADVGTDDCDDADPCPPLPEGVINVHVLAGSEVGANTYGVLTFTGADGLNGEHGAWCLEGDLAVYHNSFFDATLICSLDEEAEDCVDFPENIDALNCLLNMIEGSGWSMPSIQTAIWALLDNSGKTVSGYDQTEVDAIVAAALLCASLGYEPEAGDLIGVFVKPVDPELQPFVIPVPVPECQEETAWATEEGDYPFTNQNGQVTGWGTYFLYDVANGVQVDGNGALAADSVKSKAKGSNQLD